MAKSTQSSTRQGYALQTWPAVKAYWGKQQETEGVPWQELLNKASDNLKAGCEHYKSEVRVRQEALKALREDCTEDGDLFWLKQKSPETVKEAERMLS